LKVPVLFFFFVCLKCFSTLFYCCYSYKYLFFFFFIFVISFYRINDIKHCREVYKIVMCPIQSNIKQINWKYNKIRKKVKINKIGWHPEKSYFVFGISYTFNWKTMKIRKNKLWLYCGSFLFIFFSFYFSSFFLKFIFSCLFFLSPIQIII
jgi:hypothetical protein